MANDNPSNSSHWLSTRLFIVLLVAFLLSVGGGGLGLAQVTEWTFPEVMSILSVPSSLALSAILAYLYFRMSKIQSDQRDIDEQQSNLMKSQHDLMQAEYTPILSLGEISIKSVQVGGLIESIQESDLDLDVKDRMDIPRERLVIPLYNMGDGTATNLKIDVEVSPLNDGEETGEGYQSLHRAIEPTGGSTYGYIKADKRSIPLTGHWHNFLEPGKTKFSAKMLFRMEFSDSEFLNLPFSGIIHLLQNRDEDHAKVKIRLTYEDIVGNSDELRVLVYDFNVNEVKTLEDVILSGKLVKPDIPIRGNKFRSEE